MAERAVRHLRRLGRRIDSRTLAAELLRTRTSDETAATKLLRAAFAGDPRLDYRRGTWIVEAEEIDLPDGPDESVLEPDRALLLLDGRPEPGAGFVLEAVSVLRLAGDDVVSACGGEPLAPPRGNRLRRTIREALEGAVPVMHDAPGARRAFESWLGEPLDAPVSLRELARDRLALPARHDWQDLMARLSLRWRESDDPLERADHLDACLEALRRPGESLVQLRSAATAGAPLDWSRFAFDRAWLDALPATPGTYRFLDAGGELLYVGKSKNLRDRLRSYFREDRPRPARVERLLARLARIEVEPSGSELEAMLREAAAIRSERPSGNVQRAVHARGDRARRLRSILILEPGEGRTALRAYLIHRGRLIGSVPVGPRGGGLRKIERLLEDRFFEVREGPGPGHVEGPDLDVEVVVRWLAANRDRVVAFDPTDLRTSREVIERLRWFLRSGGPFDPDGSPVHTR